MSYGLMVYAVDLDKVVAACGSGDDELRRAICDRFRQHLQRLADWFAEGAPSPFDAVATLIQGGPMEGRGSMYAYALETIVKHFGEFLNNDAFSPCNEHFLESVDHLLAQLGAPSGLETAPLLYGSLPVRLPTPDSFPGYGHWSRETVAAAHAALAGAVVPDDADAYVREGVAAVQGWLATAAGRNEAIVAFYY